MSALCSNRAGQVGAVQIRVGQVCGQDRAGEIPVEQPGQGHGQASTGQIRGIGLRGLDSHRVGTRPSGERRASPRR